MAYKYNKLRGRIIEKYGTQSEFARVLGCSNNSVSKKMTQKTEFSQGDMTKWASLLGIDISEYSEYFFK